VKPTQIEQETMMVLTKSEYKQEILKEQGAEFHKFVASRRSRLAKNDDQKLPMSRLFNPGQKFQTHDVLISNETKYADLFTPSYWSHVADRFRLGDVIVVRDDGLTFISTLIVTQADPVRDFAMVQEIQRKELVPMKIEQPEIDGFTTRYEGLNDGWQVIRSADGHIMKGNFPTQHDATNYIRTDLKTTKIT
jgi:hypothetical protein